MKERGMLFSGEMVNAVLDGRKSQTRRIVKPQPSLVDEHGLWFGRNPMSLKDVKCPHGVAGDRIWVRETWRVKGGGAGLKISELSDAYFNELQFKADDDQSYIDKYYPSIFMPRWASRITLEIMSVRVERLQSITETDAMAEGWNFNVNEDSITWYRKLWDRINKKPGTRWADNPWVYVIEFRNISVWR